MSIYVLLGQRLHLQPGPGVQRLSVFLLARLYGSSHPGCRERVVSSEVSFLYWAMGSPSTVTQKLSEQS